jgi:hypothetical protein
MLFALGAVSSVWDALQSVTSPSKASSVQTASPGQTATNPFDIDSGASSTAGGPSGSGPGGVQISPQTMSALIAAQSQSGASNSAPTDPSQALQDLFSQIDADGNGAVTKQEFENALGAGGTNLAAADDVFSKLDSNGDGSVSLEELKQALQGAGHHGGHHHMHAGGLGDAGSADGTDPTSSGDPLLAALAGASATTVTNGDGSTTTSITYADGSKVSLTMPSASTSASAPSSPATSSYNWIEQLIQREARALSTSVSGAVSVSA